MQIRFIDKLRPDDLVGLHAYPTGGAHADLTNDHASVKTALDRIMALFDRPSTRFNLSPSEVIDIASHDHDALMRVAARECRTDTSCRKQVQMEAESLAILFEMKIAQSLGGLRGLIEGLRALAGRKTLVLVSGGLLATDRPGGRVSASANMRDVGRAAAAANTNLFALHMDTSFLDAFSSDGRVNASTLFRDSAMFAAGLEYVADAAGGTVMKVEAGTPDRAFERVLRETSAYYLLGVEIADGDRDGRSHTIRVKVKVRGAEVRSRSEVVIPKPR